MPDVVIRDGTIIDGSGAPAFVANVIIDNGRIADVTSACPEAEETIDATGLVVAPGFIDIHSHADFTLLVDPRAVSALSQGVTLEVLGNCGHGCFPVRDQAIAKTAIYGVDDTIPVDWSSCASYLGALERAAPAVNVLTLVPNGQLRQAVTGVKDTPANDEELSAMLHLLDEGMEAGAFGISTGLEYPLERGADQDEIVTLLRRVATQGGFYATHTRNRDDGAIQAVAEAIQSARDAGIRLQISHLLPRGTAEHGIRCIELVDKARNDGDDIGFDMHTRTFSMTFLHAMLPAWALENGLRHIDKVVSAPRLRSRILAHDSMLSKLGWHRIVLLDNDIVPEFARLTIDEIGRRIGLPAKVAALNLIERARLHRQPLMVIAPVYSQEDQKRAFAHELCVPGSDAVTLAPDGPLAKSTFHGAYDWAAWFYRFAVNEPGFLSREEAIHRLTGRPASIVGLEDRGLIRREAKADIAIFDEGFGHTTDLWTPNSIAHGMRYVFVNGALAFADGSVTGNRNGEVLRRSR